MNCSSIATQKVCCEGDLEVLLSNMSTIADAERWSIVFFVGPITCSNPQTYVIASYDGTNYNNCKLVENGNVLCFFKNPQLGCGQLCYKLYLGVSDENFAPSLRDDVYPVATNYELGPWPTDSVQPQLDLLVLSGIINAQIVGATATSLPPGSEPTVTLGGTATERTFAFGIPAGANGTDGTDGMDAAITGATASVGTGVGNPTVEVTLGGTPSQRTFAFAFDGLIPAGAVLYNGAQTLTPQQQEQARVNIGAFAKNQFAGPQYYAVDTSLFPQISSFNPEDTIYDDEADTIYSILNHPINLLVAVQNLKVVKAHTYSMVYENNDSSLVLIGNYIYATIGGNMTFLRRINKETLEEEMAVSYSGKIDGLPGCGLYVAGQKLFLRAKDNILYLVDKDELTLSDTGFHGITTICNVTKDVIAFADDSNIYLYDGESVLNQISIPAEYNDIKYLNNYRGNKTTDDLKYLIASVDNARALLYIDIVESKFTKGSTPLIAGGTNKYVGYKRIFNLPNAYHMCIASKGSSLAGANNYALNSPAMMSIFQIGFHLVDAYLYGNRDIYCAYGGYFMR